MNIFIIVHTKIFFQLDNFVVFFFTKSNFVEKWFSKIQFIINSNFSIIFKLKKDEVLANC